MSKGEWYAYYQNPTGGASEKVSSREWKYTSKFLKDCGIDFNFRFMGLYDTVPAFGLAQNNDMENLEDFKMGLDVTNSKFRSIVHAVAMNENRYQFSRRSSYISQADAN